MTIEVCRPIANMFIDMSVLSECNFHCITSRDHRVLSCDTFSTLIYLAVNVVRRTIVCCVTEMVAILIPNIC